MSPLMDARSVLLIANIAHLQLTAAHVRAATIIKHSLVSRLATKVFTPMEMYAPNAWRDALTAASPQNAINARVGCIYKDNLVSRLATKVFTPMEMYALNV